MPVVLRRTILFGLLLGAGFTSLSHAAEKRFKNKYQNIEVVWFENQPGIAFPPDYLVAMMEDIVTQLQKSGIFKQVLRQGERPQAADAATLRLTGTVTKFNPGSRRKRSLKRLWIGTAYTPIGNTQVVVNIRFLDRANNGLLLEKKVKGTVGALDKGLLGGESISATRYVAKKIVQVAKEQF